MQPRQPQRARLTRGRVVVGRATAVAFLLCVTLSVWLNTRQAAATQHALPVFVSGATHTASKDTAASSGSSALQGSAGDGITSGEASVIGWSSSQVASWMMRLGLAKVSVPAARAV